MSGLNNAMQNIWQNPWTYCIFWISPAFLLSPTFRIHTWNKNKSGVIHLSYEPRTYSYSVNEPHKRKPDRIYTWPSYLRYWLTWQICIHALYNWLICKSGWMSSLIRCVLMNWRYRELVHQKPENGQSVIEIPHALQCQGYLQADIYIAMNQGSTYTKGIEHQSKTLWPTVWTHIIGGFIVGSV